jgi:hypothetical protein
MNAQAFINKVNWIRRRARRIENFFCETRSNAVSAAALDWIDFNPLAPSRAPRSCAQLGLCRHPSHRCLTGQCHGVLMGLFIPIAIPIPPPRLAPLQPLPSLAPGVLDGPWHKRRSRADCLADALLLLLVYGASVVLSMGAVWVLLDWALS